MVAPYIIEQERLPIPKIKEKQRNRESVSFSKININLSQDTIFDIFSGLVLICVLELFVKIGSILRK